MSAPATTESAARHSVTLSLTGMHCASCVLHIEEALQSLPSVEASVNLATERAEVKFDPALADESQLISRVGRAGYGAQVIRRDSPSADGASAPAVEVEAPLTAGLRRDLALTRLRTTLIWSTGLTVPVMILNMWMPHWPALGWLLLALTLPVWGLAGWEFHLGAWRAARGGSSTMDTLVSLGTSAAFLFSSWGVFSGAGHHTWYFDTAATIVTLILLGRYLEMRARGRASEAISRLLRLQPQTARIERDAAEVEIPFASVRVGDILIIRPGERIATDSLVLTGHSAVDESMFTGESLPVEKKPGDALAGGTINHNGLLRARATRVGQDTTLAQMIRLVEQAQGSKAPIQRLADRVSAAFVPLVILTASLTFVGWMLLGPAGFAAALQNAIAVLIVACPCAMGLATPTAIMVGTGRGAESGMLIKGGEALEAAGRVDTILLDKTGTLTAGRPEVTDVIPLQSSAEELLALATAVEAGSEHPLGKAIVRHARERGSHSSVSVMAARAVPGQGIEAGTSAGKIIIGTSALLEASGISTAAAQSELSRLQAQGKTALLVARHDSLAGIIALADRPRPEAAEAVAQLRAMGLRVGLITGDNARTAQAIAAAVGIEDVRAGVLPGEKAAVVADLQKQGRAVAMAGDGINDAPALAQADLGIAIGSGTDVAIEAADVTLVGGELRAVPRVIALSRRTVRIIRQNLFWAFAYNVLLIPLAVAGRLHPMFAAAAMAFSSVSVVANSLRLRRS